MKMNHPPAADTGPSPDAWASLRQLQQCREVTRRVADLAVAHRVPAGLLVEVESCCNKQGRTLAAVLEQLMSPGALASLFHDQARQ